ncbi:hypothetical protein J9B28_28035, partial [Klebsiella pneumoniae]
TTSACIKSAKSELDTSFLMSHFSSGVCACRHLKLQSVRRRPFFLARVRTRVYTSLFSIPYFPDRVYFYLN